MTQISLGRFQFSQNFWFNWSCRMSGSNMNCLEPADSPAEALHFFTQTGWNGNYHSTRLAVTLEQFLGAYNAKSQEVRSPTCEVLLTSGIE